MPAGIPPELCARCKGYKRLCGLPTCPILDRFRHQLSASLRVSDRILEGSSPPSLLVGESGYPRVSVYYSVPPGVHGDEARSYEDPVEWSSRGVPLGVIIGLRSSMVSAGVRVDVRRPWDLYSREYVLASLSRRPVSSEVELAKAPVPRLSFNGVTKPLGPSAPAVRIRVGDSPRLERKLESIIWDDVKASTGIVELYRSGVDIYRIQRVLSAGMMGRARDRRIVPTRWAITAVDDVLSRFFRSKIRDYRSVGETMLYHGEYLGNRFFIIIMPGEGSVEWIELWQPGSLWTREARDPIVYYLEEDPLGRSSDDDGGFSAARLSLLEYMYRSGFKGDAVIIREITPSYYAPVGNWHIRETVKRALERGPVARGSLDEVLSRLRGGMGRSYPVVGRSWLLGGRGRRARITDFL